MLEYLAVAVFCVLMFGLGVLVASALILGGAYLYAASQKGRLLQQQVYRVAPGVPQNSVFTNREQEQKDLEAMVSAMVPKGFTRDTVANGTPVPRWPDGPQGDYAKRRVPRPGQTGQSPANVVRTEPAIGEVRRATGPGYGNLGQRDPGGVQLAEPAGNPPEGLGNLRSDAKGV